MFGLDDEAFPLFPFPPSLLCLGLLTFTSSQVRRGGVALAVHAVLPLRVDAAEGVGGEEGREVARAGLLPLR